MTPALFEHWFWKQNYNERREVKVGNTDFPARKITPPPPPFSQTWQIKFAGLTKDMMPATFAPTVPENKIQRRGGLYCQVRVLHGMHEISNAISQTWCQHWFPEQKFTHYSFTACQSCIFFIRTALANPFFFFSSPSASCLFFIFSKCSQTF